MPRPCTHRNLQSTASIQFRQGGTRLIGLSLLQYAKQSVLALLKQELVAFQFCQQMFRLAEFAVVGGEIDNRLVSKVPVNRDCKIAQDANGTGRSRCAKKIQSHYAFEPRTLPDKFLRK